MTSPFRNYVFEPSDPRVSSLRGLDARQYAEAVKSDSFAGPMIVGWSALYPEPYRGITTDGVIRRGLYRIEPAKAGEAAPTAAMVDAARAALAVMSDEQRSKLSYPVDAHEWRGWANPEFMQHDNGLRLDELSADVRDALLAVVEASLSPAGYQLTRDLMRINGFLGAVVELPLLMNEFSYNVAFFGEPHPVRPWGWQLFGHHVALNCLVLRDQMVVSPVFFGAEPDTIDEGEFAGLRVFDRRIAVARDLMSKLPEHQRRAAIVYEQMVDPAMPPGRIHPGDERHLGGCFQDNRVIPNEGVLVSEMAPAHRELVGEIIRDFLSYLPAGPAAARVRDIEKHLAETWFSWIGGWTDGEPFYFRIQNPVVILELDHHSGVFLKNDESAAFHIHTVIRTPNGNDYGRVLLGAVLGRPLAP